MGRGPPSLFALLLFEIILEAEDQNNEFNMPDQKPRLSRINQTVKYFRVRMNMEVSWPFKCLHTFWTRSGVVNCYLKLFTVFQIWFLI